MNKILRWSLGLFTILMSFMTVGCTELDEQDLEFKFKSLEEYKEDINNLTVEMEVIFQGKHSKYLFTNNSQVYVQSITDPDGLEYGYVFDSSDNTLFSLDRGNLLLESKDEDILANVSDILSNSYLLFFTSLDSPIITYEGKEIVSNRICHKYKATVIIDDKEFDYHLSIDDETELCLRCNCISENRTQSFFETKVFEYEPKTAEYEQQIDDLRLQLQQNKK